MTVVELRPAAAEEVLAWTYKRFRRVALVASFQAESMVLIDMACAIVPEPEVLTLDTGRLHEETHEFIEQVQAALPDSPPHPLPGLRRAGRDDRGARDRCSSAVRWRCATNAAPCARSTRWLGRCVDYDAWITGLRREQTPTRAETPVVAADSGHGGITKVVPLAGWSRAEVWDYLARPGHRPSPAVRPRLHVDRLRAVHACHRSRGERASRALVVGRGLGQGVPAPPADRRLGGGPAGDPGQCPAGSSTLNFAAMSTEIAS